MFVCGELFEAVRLFQIFRDHLHLSHPKCGFTEKMLCLPASNFKELLNAACPKRQESAS
jgi:hypothetical protein